MSTSLEQTIVEDVDKKPSQTEIEIESLSEELQPDPRHTEDTKFKLTSQESSREWVQVIAISWSLFNIGWSDASTGPLLPTYQRVYRIGFIVVSLLFILNCVGVFCGAGVLIVFGSRIGFGKLIVIGACMSLVAYAILAAAPPFPAMVVAFWINGFGLSLQDAQSNGFVASLREHGPLKMGLIHAAYGAGALVAPLVATQFAPLRRWSFYYFTSLGLSFLNVMVLCLVFRFKKQSDLIARFNDYQDEEFTEETAPPKHNPYKQIMKTRNVHLLAIFCLIYIGVETTTGSWIVTYIIQERGGGPASGYVSAGFFGGLTAGRLLLIWINSKVGEYRVIFLYAGISLGLELTIWLVHSLVGNAVAVSLIGFLLGPMYPIMIRQAGKILPKNILTGSIGWMAGIGAAGSALLPFMAGALAGRFGIVAMQPLLIILLCIMCTLWFLIPSKPRSTVKA